MNWRSHTRNEARSPEYSDFLDSSHDQGDELFTDVEAHSRLVRASNMKVHVYYESIKRELQIRPIYECRCDDRLQTKVQEFTRLTYTGFLGGLEHLKIETRLMNEKTVNALGEYVT
jgi:hypothetical protein